MGTSQAPFDPDMAVRILQDGRHKASGYLVADRLVLTCQHFLDGGGLTVATRDGARTSPAQVLAAFAEHDIALLACDQDLAHVTPATLGVVERTGRRSLSFEMYGWPLWSTESSADGLLEAGRLVRGIFEPADTSPDGNLVLQPSRTGGGAQAGWGGMSGAAVFSLDRLVGVQRRQLNRQDASSIEARPIGLLADDPSFVQLMSEHGIDVEAGWAPGVHEAPGQRRFEVHAPSAITLLSPVVFHIRTEGWDRISHSFHGVDSVINQAGSVDAAPLVEVRGFFADASQVGATGRLDVEATTSEGESRTVEHDFRLHEPAVADVAAAFEMAVWVLDRVRSGGPPSNNLRAAGICRLVLARLEAAIALMPSNQLVVGVSNGIAGIRTCLVTETSFIEERLRDPDAKMSPDARQDSKYAYHRAYSVRELLRERGFGQARPWRDEEVNAQMPLLGFADTTAFAAYMQPSVESVLSSSTGFARAFVALLQESESVDVKTPDYTTAQPKVQAELYDLVNALIGQGYARWVSGFNLALTRVGRQALSQLEGAS